MENRLYKILKKNKNVKNNFFKYESFTMSYFEMYEYVNKISNKIALLNNRVSIILDNNMSYIACFFSIMKLNKVLIPLNHNISEEDLLKSIKLCDINTLCTTSYYYNKFKDYLNSYKIDIYLVDIDELIINHIFKEKIKYNYSIVLLTSGSTSKPKCVLLTDKALYHNSLLVAQSLNLSNNDKTIIMSQLCYSSTISQLLSNVMVGASIYFYQISIFIKKFDSIINENNITNFVTVPSTIELLCLHKKKDIKFNSLRFIGIAGAPFSKEKIKEIINLENKFEIVIMYGMTELGPRVSHLFSKKEINKIGSVGKPLRGIKIKILITDKVNQIGEVCVKSKSKFLKYYHNNIKNLFMNKYFKTGDIGYIDDDGYLYLCGREKNIIISNGINIYPEEIEESLKNHPSIKDARVYGEEEPIYGEIVVADILIKDNFNIEKKEIINYINQTISFWKRPKKIYLVDKIEYTLNGKIRRNYER